jgi:hypothetical protein
MDYLSKFVDFRGIQLNTFSQLEEQWQSSDLSKH